MEGKYKRKESAGSRGRRRPRDQKAVAEDSEPGFPTSLPHCARLHFPSQLTVCRRLGTLQLHPRSVCHDAPADTSAPELTHLTVHSVFPLGYLIYQLNTIKPNSSTSVILNF